MCIYYKDNTEKTKKDIIYEYTKLKGIINNRICLFNILKPYISINDITNANDDIIQGEILNEMVDQIRKAENIKLPENLSFIIPNWFSQQQIHCIIYEI